MDFLTHINAFKTFLGQEEIFTHPSDIEPFCIDHRHRFFGHTWAVLIPKTVEHVQKIVNYCYTNNIAITPQGGNTSLCGGATPHESIANKGIILALGKLNQTRDISLEDNTLTIEAGAILANVQAIAASVDRFFPLSLASEGSCQIGGNIACNAGGLNVVRYGPMRDLVLGLEYVLPNGELVSHLNPLHKNTTGYELRQQLIGSEGTLGIITAATLKLFAKPTSVLTAWIGVENVKAAVQLLTLIKAYFAERLSSFELISQEALKLTETFSHQSMPIEDNWHILLELTDSLTDTDLSEPLMTLLEEHHFLNTIIAQSQQNRQQLWTLRENISDAQKSIGASIKHDIAMPIANIASFIQECAPLIQKKYPTARIIAFGHLGDGSLHYNVFLPEILNNDLYQYEADINALVYNTVLKYQGTIAAEHGIGQLKKQWLHKIRTPAELKWMQQQKQSLDSKNIMNPGKVLP